MQAAYVFHVFFDPGTQLPTRFLFESSPETAIRVSTGIPNTSSPTCQDPRKARPKDKTRAPTTSHLIPSRALTTHPSTTRVRQVEDLSKVLKIPPTRLQTLLTALTAAKCLRLTSGSYSNSPKLGQDRWVSSESWRQV